MINPDTARPDRPPDRAIEITLHERTRIATEMKGRPFEEKLKWVIGEDEYERVEVHEDKPRKMVVFTIWDKQ